MVRVKVWFGLWLGRVMVRVRIRLGIGLGLGFRSGQSQCLPLFRCVNYHILIKSGTRRSHCVPPFRSRNYTNQSIVCNATWYLFLQLTILPQFSCHEAEDQVTTRCIKCRMHRQTSTNTLSSRQCVHMWNALPALVIQSATLSVRGLLYLWLG